MQYLSGGKMERDDAWLRPRLMVLTSDKGWPYSWKWKENKSARDCYVNCEVERVWRIVKGDLTEWFSPDAGDLLYIQAACVDWDVRDWEVDGCRLVPPLPAAALRCQENPSGCPLFWWKYEVSF
ncbi:putative retrotransposon hot spot (RHS) protein [Trypanosoma cruzi]|nr:putative retrotransposon hot spot (RHS) protein [Trypanosoma cruzi]